MRSDLWAITAYFNPVSYGSRLANYRIFREHLDVPLVTVELAYGNSFELQKGDAEILIQVKGQDVLWQKERLLNLALQALPAECEIFAWLDCDVLFLNQKWPELTMQALRERPMVHLFSERYNLPSEVCVESLGNPPSDSRIPSLLYKLSQGLAVDDDFVSDAPLKAQPSTAGLAWAGRRSVFEEVGFYDGCIVGSGDRAQLLAALGFPGRFVKDVGMGKKWERHYLDWAQRFWECTAGNVGFIPGVICHLWHGELQQRDYRYRHRVLTNFDFDPIEDIRIGGDSGIWRWNSNKTEMHRYVSEYFRSRREDG